MGHESAGKRHSKPDLQFFVRPVVGRFGGFCEGVLIFVVGVVAL